MSVHLLANLSVDILSVLFALNATYVIIDKQMNRQINRQKNMHIFIGTLFQNGMAFRNGKAKNRGFVVRNWNGMKKLEMERLLYMEQLSRPVCSFVSQSVCGYSVCIICLECYICYYRQTDGQTDGQAEEHAHMY